MKESEKTFSIAVLAGDGIGPEVMAEALKVLRLVADQNNLTIQLNEGAIGGIAYDRYGSPFPAETEALCRQADAVLLGCIGGAQWDGLPPEKRPEIGGLLALRKMMKLYANIRPIVLFDELKEVSPLSSRILTGTVDLVTVRELASGIYFGEPTGLTEEEGFDTMRYRQEDVGRIAEQAFRMAANRRKKVTSVDKANVLRSSMLWRRTVKEVATAYPDITLEHMYVDNASMQLILNPMQFDVLLTTNLFGDILSDESASISGSLGMLPSASLGEKTHLYEPAGGSAPDIAGRGIANPIAQILSVAMMFEYSLNRPDIAGAIYLAVERAIQEGYRTADITTSGFQSVGTAAMGDAICKSLKE